MPDTPPPAARLERTDACRADSAADARFTRRVGSFTLGTLVSRLTGVLRESVFAHLFGASAVTDAFNVGAPTP